MILKNTPIRPLWEVEKKCKKQYCDDKYVKIATTNYVKNGKNCNEFLCSYFEKKKRFREVADGGEIDWQVFYMMVILILLLLWIKKSC